MARHPAAVSCASDAPDRKGVFVALVETFRMVAAKTYMVVAKQTRRSTARSAAVLGLLLTSSVCLSDGRDHAHCSCDQQRQQVWGVALLHQLRHVLVDVRKYLVWYVTKGASHS